MRRMDIDNKTAWFYIDWSKKIVLSGVLCNRVYDEDLSEDVVLFKQSNNNIIKIPLSALGVCLYRTYSTAKKALNKGYIKSTREEMKSNV